VFDDDQDGFHFNLTGEVNQKSYDARQRELNRRYSDGTVSMSDVSDDDDVSSLATSPEDEFSHAIFMSEPNRVELHSKTPSVNCPDRPWSYQICSNHTNNAKPVAGTYRLVKNTLVSKEILDLPSDEDSMDSLMFEIDMSDEDTSGTSSDVLSEEVYFNSRTMNNRRMVSDLSRPSSTESTHPMCLLRTADSTDSPDSPVPPPTRRRRHPAGDGRRSPEFRREWALFYGYDPYELN